MWELPNKTELGVPTRLYLEKYKKFVKNSENDQLRQTRWSMGLLPTFEEIVSQATEIRIDWNFHYSEFSDNETLLQRWSPVKTPKKLLIKFHSIRISVAWNTFSS